jgi:hypothetical protein
MRASLAAFAALIFTALPITPFLMRPFGFGFFDAYFGPALVASFLFWPLGAEAGAAVWRAFNEPKA